MESIMLPVASADPVELILNNQPASTFQPQPQTSPKQSSYVPPPPGSRPCSVCKNVHLSCDRQRPCSRCVRLGREQECVDPPERIRGRPLTDTDRPATIKRRKANRDPSQAPKKSTDINTVVREPHLRHEPPASDALVTSQRRIDVIMAQGRVAYYWTKNTIVGCTQEFADYMGYQQSDLIGVSNDVIQPPELVEANHRKMDVFIEKLPADAVEVEVNCCSLHMSRNGRRFEARIKGSVYLRNKTVSLAVVKVMGVNRDNLPPGTLPLRHTPHVKLRRASGEVVDFGHIHETLFEIYEAHSKSMLFAMSPAPLPQQFWTNQYLQQSSQSLSLQSPPATPQTPQTPRTPSTPVPRSQQLVLPSATALILNPVSNSPTSNSSTTLARSGSLDPLFDADDLTLGGILFL